MCFEGCGTSLQHAFNSYIKKGIEKKFFPPDASIVIDPEPNGLGLHKLLITIESEQHEPVEQAYSSISETIRETIEDLGFEVIDELTVLSPQKSRWTNAINILINLLSIGVITTCALLFPPSILLTLGLTVVSFLTSAFTSREYLLAFYRNFRSKSFANMATTVSLGWFLSLAHTLFHASTMPLATSFSMLFMSFIMPLMLITCINGMDEIKRLIMEKSQKIYLKSIKRLFPELSDTYLCYEFTLEETSSLSQQITRLNKKNQNFSLGNSAVDEEEKNFLLSLKNLLNPSKSRQEKKNLLKEGMLIEVKPTECFPVDCILVQGTTVIDASLLTGESQQRKQCWQNIPAGAINLGEKVTVYAEKNAYSSTINRLLFLSNRARNAPQSAKGLPKFAYFYAALILLGIVVSILIPAALGVITVSLVMQNVIGIVFSLCFCTVAIAHELPKLISMHHRNKKGIYLRDYSLLNADSEEIHTVVFDKTGTLTTGNSVVESTDIDLDSPLWSRIYLLEKKHGKGHPLAKAIQAYYKSKFEKQIPFDAVTSYEPHEKNRGLSARVLEKLLQVGSYEYLKSKAIVLPEPNKRKMERGLSPVYVAEEGEYKGVIYIKHEVRKGVIKTLNRLKSEGKKIIMLTGDNRSSAIGFNQQLNAIFEEEAIHAGQTPKDKESFLKHLMSQEAINPNGVWFCGDGLNDAPCCRMVGEKGGVSCAISANDKSAFFTDISLNGSFDYLFKHEQLNRAVQLNIAQNKGILIYSTFAFLAFIISFSIVGIAVSPLIPAVIMLSTTLSILFNAYRTQIIIDNALDEFTPLPKKLLSSHFPLVLLFLVSTLLICSILVATISTGGLTLPIFVFAAGVATTFSSICTLSAFALMGAFVLLLSASLLTDKIKPRYSYTNTHQETANFSPMPISEELKISEGRRYPNFFPRCSADGKGAKQSRNEDDRYTPIPSKSVF